MYTKFYIVWDLQKLFYYLAFIYFGICVFIEFNLKSNAKLHRCYYENYTYSCRFSIRSQTNIMSFKGMLKSQLSVQFKLLVPNFGSIF